MDLVLFTCPVLCCAGLGCAVLFNCPGLCWAVLGCARLGYAGLGWVMLGCAGLGSLPALYPAVLSGWKCWD